MDINMLPDKCPKCNNKIFKQKVAIEGFANKLYSMALMEDVLDSPMTVLENELSENDYYNEIVCNACGETIIQAEKDL